MKTPPPWKFTVMVLTLLLGIVLYTSNDAPACDDARFALTHQREGAFRKVPPVGPLRLRPWLLRMYFPHSYLRPTPRLPEMVLSDTGKNLAY